MQDHGLDAVGAIALNEVCASKLWLWNSHIVALDRDAVQLHVRKVAPLPDGSKKSRTTWNAYSGMLPCLRFGWSTRLDCSMRRARISFGRVWRGSMPSSM